MQTKREKREEKKINLLLLHSKREGKVGEDVDETKLAINSQLFVEGRTHIQSPSISSCAFRLSLPEMCHYGMWIILS